jgi:O-antigen/teichoic acid export membrane protein
MHLINSIKKIFDFKNGHYRTIKAKRNIFYSLIFRSLNMLIGFTLLPITINSLNPTKYGIWVTLNSIVAWFNFFDVGLGHGLRNKFAESLARNEHNLAKKYVSTTYFLLATIVLIIIFLFLFINPFINWIKILNIQNDSITNKEIHTLTTLVFIAFGLNFIFQQINVILYADQQPSKVIFIEFLGKFLTISLIWILVQLNLTSLTTFGLILSGSPVLILFFANIYFFLNNFKDYSPSIKFFDLSLAKDLYSLGLKFFMIRISAILLYSTNNFIIARLFGPEEVTPYSIAMSYFNVLFVIFNVFITPFWSAFTEAWIKKEIFWIKTTINKLILFWLAIGIIGLLMLIFSTFVYEFWIGKNVNINFSISFLVFLWNMFICWNGIFSQFLYGVSAVKLQSILAFAISLMNVPLSFFLGNIFGIEGVILVSVLLAFIQMWIYPIQFFKIINFKAEGIWAK